MAEKEITLNQLGVMIEKIGNDVKAVAEGHGVIRSEMQRGFEDVKGQIKETNDKLRFVAQELGQKIEEVKERVGRVEGKVERIENKLDLHMRQPAHV